MTTRPDMIQPWFPQTKLHPPQIGADILIRPSLLTHLDHTITSHPFTLVSAPAGSGKTTLMAAWQEEKDEGGRMKDEISPLTVVWLRLDEGDNNPVTFFTALLAAMRQAAPYLLENLPPDMRLVAATRYDPNLSLARLRLQGRLAEFRLDDLRFSDDEAAALLNDYLQLDLAAADLDALQTHTGGWVAGLRLLVLSLNQLTSEAGRAAFIGNLSQSGRHVFKFLADEILNDQPFEMRQFLLETAVLDELTPEMCTAVTQRRESAQLLDDLYRRNLFLTLVESESGGLAYHYHDLFADFLRQRLARELPPEHIQTLHCRAAEAAVTSAQAIRHYLAANMWTAAAQVVSQAGWSLLAQGLHSQLHDWILALPKETRTRTPWLGYFLGTIAYQRGRYYQARPLLERALQTFTETGDQTGQAESLLQLGSMASGQHDTGRAAALLEKALSLPLLPQRQAVAHLNLAWVGVYCSDWEQVGRETTAAIQGALSVDEPLMYHVLAQQLHLPLAFAPGAAPQLEQYCHRVLSRLGETASLARAGACTLLGGFVFLDVNIDFLALGNSFVRGDEAGFERYRQEQLPRFEQLPGAQEWLTSYLYARGRLLWLQNRLEEAQLVYARMKSLDRLNDTPENRVALLMMPALLDMSAKQYQQAENRLRQAAQIQAQLPFTMLFGNARVLLATLYQRWNRLEDALDVLESVLAETVQLEMPGLILMEGETAVPLLELAIRYGIHKTVAARARTFLA